MNRETTLQYLRLASDPKDTQFESRLALAIHRQSTAPGFIASLEGAVMAEANTWIALVAWSQPEFAEAATQEWFESDYHAEFAKNIETIEANEVFSTQSGVFEDMHGSRHARFLWIEHFDSADEEQWATYRSRRITDLHTRDGFADAFSFNGLQSGQRHGLVSAWNDTLRLRAASESIQSLENADSGRSEQEHLRITSSNTTSS